MNEIKLLAVENVISRKKRQVQQNLSFFILVESVRYDKSIAVIWAGEDGVWHGLPANFHSKPGRDKEYWQAQATINLTADQSLPGNIQFGLRYQASGEEYWDNNNGLNYSSQADSGIQTAPGFPVLNIGFQPALNNNQKFIPITVAVDKSLDAEKITVHWTTDNWHTTHKARCYFKRKYWDKELSSNARNPNQYGVQIWKGWLKIGSTFRVQYSIECEGRGQTLWDNNHGNNYSVSHEPLKVMILNLHCYQEDNQDYKLSQIAKAINELNADIVCFQEVAEYWNNGQGDWDSNSAKIINDRLDAPYHIYTDWSHLGFDKYREGVAILSRYPLLKQESGYVSNSDDPFSIHSRKVVMTQVHVPYFGLINVFSAHLSWWEDGFQEQFKRLHEWANAKHNWHVKATMLCGDFNVTAGSGGYYLVVDRHEYDDQYLAANAVGLPEQNSRLNDPYWQRHLADDYRIDYIFLNKNSEIH
ncbi:MAG: carbohydrate-binding protein, partial [Methylovulum sp.]|nr:carbohydrate-binding protein [Methylovulum sp.]